MGLNAVNGEEPGVPGIRERSERREYVRMQAGRSAHARVRMACGRTRMRIGGEHHVVHELASSFAAAANEGRKSGVLVLAARALVLCQHSRTGDGNFGRSRPPVYAGKASRYPTAVGVGVRAGGRSGSNARSRGR